LLALALLAGCPDRKKEETPGPSPDAAERPASLRAGVKVPLPSGWSAQVAADGSFQAGPPGRATLRVDLRPGEGSRLPSAETLAHDVRAQLKDFAVSLDQEEGTDTFTWVHVTLAPKLADGGVGAQAPSFFGARRVSDDLFLCASLPGASGEEVRLGSEACRNIQVQAAPR
jgi:hypothetical protein